jgi:hypothetical protein
MVEALDRFNFGRSGSSSETCWFVPLPDWYDGTFFDANPRIVHNLQDGVCQPALAPEGYAIQHPSLKRTGFFDGPFEISSFGSSAFGSPRKLWLATSWSANPVLGKLPGRLAARHGCHVPHQLCGRRHHTRRCAGATLRPPGKVVGQISKAAGLRSR